MTTQYDKPLTVEDLADRPEEEIDYSDIPELDAAFWDKARLVAPSTKPVVSLRLSEDVIAFFKRGDPKGYTRRMAAVLSAYAAARRGD